MGVVEENESICVFSAEIPRVKREPRVTVLWIQVMATEIRGVSENPAESAWYQEMAL